MKSKAYIIGSGIAGIAASIRLRQAGFDVQVFEASETAGGKISEFEKDGFRFDAGPSLFTMPEWVDELFVLCGKNPRDYYSYSKLPVICRYFFANGKQLDAFDSPEAFAGEVQRKTGEPANHVIDYLGRSRELYELTEKVFLQSSLHRWRTYFSTDAWKAFFHLYKLDSSRSLHNRNESSFNTDETVQLFDRYATYNGSNPFHAPATLKVIPHLEFQRGAFFPDEGIYAIVKALVKLAEDIGVTFHYHSPVKKLTVTKNRITALEFSGGKTEVQPGDIVISNMDVMNTYRKLLPGEPAPEKILQQPRSTSALVFYWGMKKTFPQLHLHNIFFSADYKTEFDFLSRKKDVFDDPTVYVNISSKMKPGDAPAGCENWFTMINAPHLAGQDWDSIVARSRKNIIAKLSHMLGEHLEPLILSETILDPRGIEAGTSSYLGALYGSSSNNRYAAFLRHKNFSSRFGNLYFCGGSVHPGGGIPLCLMSAKIVSDIVKDRMK